MIVSVWCNVNLHATHKGKCIEVLKSVNVCFISIFSSIFACVSSGVGVGGNAMLYHGDSLALCHTVHTSTVCVFILHMQTLKLGTLCLIGTIHWQCLAH